MNTIVSAVGAMYPYRTGELFGNDLEKERAMIDGNHDGYLHACCIEGAIMCGGDTNPEGVDRIIEHLDGGPRCEACEIDTLRGRPDNVEEANFLARYLDLLANGKPTHEQRRVARCMSLKYGGRTPAELLTRYREAKAAERAKATEEAVA